MGNSNPDAEQITAHAVLIGDRIDTAGLEGQVLSNATFAVRVGSSGVAVVFRYGVVVFIGLSVKEEADFLETLRVRSFGKITPPEEEWAKMQVAKEAEEPIPAADLFWSGTSLWKGFWSYPTPWPKTSCSGMTEGRAPTHSI